LRVSVAVLFAPHVATLLIKAVSYSPKQSLMPLGTLFFVNAPFVWNTL